MGDHPREVLVTLPVSRLQGFLRAFVRLMCGSLLGVAVINGISGLRFVPTGSSNRLTDYAIAIALIPFALGALYLAGAGLRWLLLCGWPSPERIDFSAEMIALSLGPFGKCELDVKQLSMQYPHEIDPEEADEPFECYEDPEVQEKTRLPNMIHPDYPGQVDRLIRRFVRLDEAEIAERLTPFVRAVRQSRSPSQGSDA